MRNRLESDLLNRHPDSKGNAAHAHLTPSICRRHRHPRRHRRRRRLTVLGRRQAATCQSSATAAPRRYRRPSRTNSNFLHFSKIPKNLFFVTKNHKKWRPSFLAPSCLQPAPQRCHLSSKSVSFPFSKFPRQKF